MIRDPRTGAHVLLRIVAATVVAIVLIVAVLAVPPTPTASARGDRVVLFGTVVGTAQTDQIDIATRGGVISLEIDEHTKIFGKKIRGKRGKLKLSKINAGMTVAGYYTEGDSGPVAGTLTFVGRKHKKSFKHLVGLLVEQNRSTLTIRTSNGDLVEVEFEDDEDDEDVPEPGSMIATVVERDETTGELTATALQTAKETVDRLSASIGYQISAAQRELLKIRMSETAAVHMTRLHETLDEINADAQARIQAAYAEFQSKYDATLHQASIESVTVHMTGEVLSVFISELRVLSNSDGARWVFSVTKDTVIEFDDGTLGSIHDIAAGLSVEVDARPGLPPERPIAIVIRVIRAVVPAGPTSTPGSTDDTITGTIIVVDPGSGETDTIVVIGLDDGTDSAAGLTDDTVVIVDGEELTVDELEPGQVVEIVLTDDGFSAEQVTAVDSVEPTPIPGAETPSIASPIIGYTLIGTLRSIGDTGVVLDGVQLTLNDFSTSWDSTTIGQQVELRFYVDETGRLVVTGTR